MSYRVNEKGKYFTDHITKRSLPITACVRDWIIQGTIHLMGENRLKDELNDGETFIAITDVQISGRAGETTVYETPVLIVKTDQIAWIFPRDDAQPPEDIASPVAVLE